MASMNPIIKNEWLNFTLFSEVPKVPEDAALILYQSASRDMCKVYLLEDAVYSAEIRKLHFDRKAHISLKPFTFDWNVKFLFSNSAAQYVQLSFSFTVSVKDKKEAVKTVFTNNVTDISAAVLDKLNQYGALNLSREYNCLEASLLIAEAKQKIGDIVERIDYLKIKFEQTSDVYDAVSQKYIEDDIKDKLSKAEIEAKRKSLERNTELARVQQKKNEIEKIEAENAAESARIRHEQALVEEAYQTELSAKQKARERAIANEEAENIALKARKRQELRTKHNIDDLIAVDDSFRLQEQLEQQRRDQERENMQKDFEVKLGMMKAAKELLGDVDDAQMVEIIKNMFAMPIAPQIGKASSKTMLTDNNIVISDISEDEKTDV